MWTGPLVVTDPQKFLDRQTDSGSLVDENLRMQTDVDPVRLLAYYFLKSSDRH